MTQVAPNPHIQEFEKRFQEFKARLLRSCGGILEERGEQGSSNTDELITWLKEHKKKIETLDDISIDDIFRATSALFKEQKLVWQTPPDLDKLAATKNEASKNKKENTLDASGLGSTLRMVQTAADNESKLKADQINATTDTEIKTTWGPNHAKADSYRKALKLLYDNLQAENKKGEKPHQKAQRIHDTILERQKQLQGGK